MEVIVNKKPVTIEQDSKVIDLLEHLGLNRSVAIFINKKQLLLADYDNYKLSENDNIRIIKPLGGG